MTVHTCRARTQAYPLSQYDCKVPGKPLIIGMHGICFGERVEVGGYRVGVGGEVGQYNRMYTCICTWVWNWKIRVDSMRG